MGTEISWHAEHNENIRRAEQNWKDDMTTYLAWLMGWMSPAEHKLIVEYARRILMAKHDGVWDDPLHPTKGKSK